MRYRRTRKKCLFWRRRYASYLFVHNKFLHLSNAFLIQLFNDIHTVNTCFHLCTDIQDIRRIRYYF